MKRNLKILFAAILFAGAFTQDKICDHLGFGQMKLHHESKEVIDKEQFKSTDTKLIENYFVDETEYTWNENLLDYTIANEEQASPNQLAIFQSITQKLSSSSSPIEIEWKVLIDIKYKLRYFKEFDTEMYSPVFSKAVEALDGKEVIIEGFVIPSDETGKVFSLSFNPFASCFFCGKASPASVMTMFMKKKTKRYRIDEFKKFKGTLYLNQDDINEFYYILRSAEEI